MKKTSIKIPKFDNLRGVGLSSLDWSERSRLYSTVKRLSSTFDDEQLKSSSKNKIEVFCSCCKANFKVSKDRELLPQHNRKIETYEIIYVDKKPEKKYYKIDVLCTGGELVRLGKTNLDSYKLPTITHKKYFTLPTHDTVDVHVNDKLLLYCCDKVSYMNQTKNINNNKTKYSNDTIEYNLVEKTVSKINKTVKKQWYHGYIETTELYFTDGTKKSDYIILDTTII